MKNDSVLKLVRNKKTIFSASDLSLIWGIKDKNYLKTKIYRLVKSKDLFRIKKGIYSLNKDYDSKELASKLIKPSYISLQTVLAEEGIIFQYDSTVYSLGQKKFEILIGRQKYVYHQIKDDILLNSKGIIRKRRYNIASKERAVCDMLYLDNNFYFDNLDNLDWGLIFEIAEIYPSRNLIKYLKNLRKNYA